MRVEPAPVAQTEEPSTRAVEEVSEENFDSSEVEDEDEDQDRQPQPPASGEAFTRDRRTTGYDLNSIADNRRDELSSRVNFTDSNVARADRFKQKPSSPAKRIAKERKATMSTKNPPTQPSVIFGLSTAIQDPVVFCRRPELANFTAPTNELSWQAVPTPWDPLLHYQVSVTAQCSHLPEICLTCWEQHIAAQLDSKPWDAIICPHVDCSVTLAHNDVQRFASTDVCRRYDRLQTNVALQNMPGDRQCAHEGCASVAVVVPDAAATYMTCAECKRNTCLGCKHIYRNDQTCDEYRASLVDERDLDKEERARLSKMKRLVKKSEKYLDKNAKPCHNGACGLRIQKTRAVTI